jgi:hypothetical protein
MIAPGFAASGSAPPRTVAQLVALVRGCYALCLAGESGSQAPASLPTVHLCSPPGQGGAVDLVDRFGRPACWLGDGDMLFATLPASGGAILATAYFADQAAPQPRVLEIRRIDCPAPIVRVPVGEAGIAAAPQVGLEVVAHIRNRGDVRFLDAPWIGRLGPGLWIEALAVRPLDPSLAPLIEYKGLMAGGAETPWLGSGAACGSRGQGLPLIGFAMRQRTAAGSPLLDCEYSGYFASAATVGPVRNGAPCRSAVDNDPLEGLQLRLTPRPRRTAGTG